ncbi:MAG: SRPBCC family protein [Alphaproteobacteria bacterium]
MQLWKLVGLAAAGILAIVVLAAVLMRADRIETQAVLHIDAPPVVVWEAIADPDRRADWMNNVRSAAQMTGRAGEPGATMMLRVNVEDFNLSVFEEIVGSGFPDFIRTETTDNQGALSVATAYFLEPAEPGTTLEVKTIRELDESYARYFAPFIRSRSQATLEQDLDRLKVMVEAAR